MNTLKYQTKYCMFTYYSQTTNKRLHLFITSAIDQTTINISVCSCRHSFLKNKPGENYLNNCSSLVSSLLLTLCQFNGNSKHNLERSSSKIYKKCLIFPLNLCSILHYTQIINQK